MHILCQAVRDLKQRLTDELLTKEKEFKQLHLQHQLEKSQIEDLAHRQRRMFVKEKETLSRELQAQYEKEIK